MDGGPITAARIRLPLWSTDDVARIRAGERAAGWHRDFPRQDDVDAASLWQASDPWSPRSVVLRGSAVAGLAPQPPLDGVVVGSIGFFGPPQPAEDGVPEVEVGYGLVEEARGVSLATEALTAVLGAADAAGVRVRASVLPDNRPSIRVLAKCGFTQLRGSNEEGELVMARPLKA